MWVHTYECNIYTDVGNEVASLKISKLLHNCKRILKKKLRYHTENK